MQLAKQIPWWVGETIQDTSTSAFFVTGGQGSGKSHGSAIAFLANVLLNPAVPQWWAVAPTYTQAENTLLPLCVKVLADWFGMTIGNGYTVTRQKPYVLKFPSGQTIYFHSGDRPENMVSATIGGFWITEAGIQKREVWEGCTARSRDARANRIFRLVEGTPEGDNWYREIADFERRDTKNAYRRFILHTADNQENLSPHYIPNLLAAYENQPEKIKSYIFGEFASFNRGTAYWEFFASRNVEPDVEANLQLPLILSWDFQVSPLSWVALQRQTTWEGLYREKVDRAVAVGEASGKSRGLLDACAEIMATFPPEKWGNVPIKIDGGHDGWASNARADQCAFHEIRDLLRTKYKSVQIVANRAAPRVRDRLQRVNLLMAYKRYMIGSQCRKLINSYNSVSTKPGTWELVKPTGDRDLTHFSDAADYGVMNLMDDIQLEAQAGRATKGISRI